eukprot:m.63114 g.63114  ORF g.63114 m.63114 type:complete len:332 (-) comp13424_c0_seq1:34-1029(-)
MQLLPDLRPVMAYYDATLSNLKVAVCHDPLCNASTIRVVDSDGDVGQHASLRLLPDGRPVVAYYDATNLDLKLAVCRDATCTSAAIRVVDGLGSVGQWASLALAADGRAVMAYYDATHLDLLLAVCDEVDCSVRLLSSGGDYTSVQLTDDGRPVISCYASQSLVVFVCRDGACTSSVRAAVVDGYAGHHSSLQLLPDGRAVVAIMDKYSSSGADPLLVICNSEVCTTASRIYFDGQHDDPSKHRMVGVHNSLELTTDGRAVVTYHDNTDGSLHLAVCGDSDCSTFYRGIVDLMGAHPSLQLLPDGRPVIAYHDESNSELKLVVCADALCAN